MKFENISKMELVRDLQPQTRDSIVFPLTAEQDEQGIRNSRLSDVWEEEMGTLTKRFVHYKKAFVLLLSWDKDIDDLKTDQEVCAGVSLLY
jgi:hypothetical protein